MKKLFSFVISLFTMAAVNAQEVQTIQFTADDVCAAGEIKSSYGEGTFKLNLVDNNGKMAIDQSTANFGTVEESQKIEYRLKSGGKSSSNNSMTLTIPSDGTVTVYARSGNSSDETRTLAFVQGGETLSTVSVKDADAQERENASGTVTKIYKTFTQEVKAGELSLVYAVNAINFYYFEFTPSATTEPGGDDEPVIEAEQEIVFTEAVTDLPASFGEGTFKFNILANAGTNKMDVAPNTTKFGTADDYKEAKFRFRTRGKSSSTNSLTLTIPADGTLTVFARSGSTGNSSTLSFKQNGATVGDAEGYTFNDADAVDNIYPVITVDVKAGTLALEYTTAINFYYFKFTPAVTGVSGVATVPVVNDGKIYTLQGTPATLADKGVLVRNGKKFVNK